MYDDYYRFKQKPFSIAPDPAFLYLSERHREALAHLMYGLRSDGGFVLITGEVGTGKTTLIRSLIDSVPDDLDIAFVLNPRLTVNELLETLCEELGIPQPAGAVATNKHLIDRLNKHLLRTHALGRSTVVIIDEAQNLSPAVLEQIRLLTNLETNERKLVRIILLGQPELAEMLDRKDMRQLSQRITARYHLAALTRDDTQAYLTHRLSLAGGNPHLFTGAASREIHRLSRGIPRLVNVVADRALLGAYVEGRPRVGARIVRKAAREAFGQRAWLRPGLWIGAAATLALAMGGAWALRDHALAWRSGLPSIAAAPIEHASPRELPAAALAVPVPERVETQAVPSPVESPALPASAATTSPIATATPEYRESKSDRLARPPGRSSADLQKAAYATVFARWDMPLDPSELPCDQAPQVGLQCLKLNGTWADIARLDHPAVIELWDERVDPYYAAIVGQRAGHPLVQFGNEPIEVTDDELSTHWYGAFIVLWQMPPDYRGSLRIGDAGPTVAWLRQRLAATLQIDLRTPSPDRFDDGLQVALMQFQRANGIAPDGVAGPLTWIAMNSAASEALPRLNPRS